MDKSRRSIHASSTTRRSSTAAAFAIPASDVYPADLFHFRRGLVGGSLSRTWVGVVVAGVPRLYSFQHAGSRANPSTFVPAYSGAAHRFVDLGASAVTATSAANSLIAAMALDGITATLGTTDTEGRRVVNVASGTRILPPSVSTDLRERGMWGAQRDDWGTGGSGAVALNSNGGGGGTGTQHVGNPSSQGGMSGRAGRVIGAYLWGYGGFPPRLAVGSGPGYSLAPTAITMLGQGVSAAIGSPGVNGIGVVLFVDPIAFTSAANLWVLLRGADVPTTGPRFRLHAQGIVGRGDIPLNQRVLWDTTAPVSAATPIAASYVPTVNQDLGIYFSMGLIFELQNASGNYPARGEIDTWIGDQNTDATHGTQFPADETILLGETTHQRFLYPGWTSYHATQYRRAYQVAVAGETSRIAFYGPWASLTHPAGTAPALLADVGTMGPLANNAYTTMTISPRVALQTAAASGQHLSVGANYVRTDGTPVTDITLGVFLDEQVGDGCWIDAWLDERDRWHDNVVGASGARALTSGVQEYRTRSNAAMPITSAIEPYPTPMALSVTDDSPPAIALEAVRVQRAGIA